jgi:hypothetical protein
VIVAPPAAPLLWAVTGAGIDRVQVSSGEPFVVTGFQPNTAVALLVHVRDTAGALHTAPFAAFTAPPMPHVVLNEVLANALGAEPQQEWVEIYNDGTLAADLEGYRLVDAGETVLPSAVLPPGGFALLVNDEYDESTMADVPPAPGTLIVRVGNLGKNGLSNEGEWLELYDQHGTHLSAFPGVPKPQAGESVKRVHPQAPDGVESSFDRGAPTPGAVNF